MQFYRLLPLDMGQPRLRKAEWAWPHRWLHSKSDRDVRLRNRGGGAFPAAFIDQLSQHAAVEVFRVHIFEPFLAASFPMLDQVSELAGGCDDSFRRLNGLTLILGRDS